MAKFKKCSVDGCEKRLRAKGFCVTHYNRFHTNGTTESTKATNIGFCILCNERPQRTANMCDRCYSRNKARTDPLYKARRNAKFSRYRARKLGVPSEPYSAEEIMQKTGGVCGICGEPIDLAIKFPLADRFSFDHIIALSNGGNDLIENIQPAHFGCNARKGNRY